MKEFEFLKEPYTECSTLAERLPNGVTSAGYALGKHLSSGKICVVKDNEIVHITEYDDIWIEYPKDTYFKRLHWHSPDLLNFFKDGYWGTMQPDGTVVIPNEYETVLNYKQSGYIILRDKENKVACGILFSNILCLLIPFIDSWETVRQIIDYWIEHEYLLYPFCTI